MHPMSTPPGGGAAPGSTLGVQRKSRNYYDASGVLRRAAAEVPVDQSGTIVGVQYRCRQHGVAGWFSVKTAPACERCGKRMVAMEVKRPPLLPWRELWGAAERPLRPVWALAGMAAAGWVVDAAEVPLVTAGAAAAATPLVGFVAKRGTTLVRSRRAARKGTLDFDDPGGDKRVRAAIDRASRSVSYAATGGWAALAAAAVLGVDPSTWAGRAAMVALVAAWLLPAASWWRKERDRRNRPVRPAEVALPADEPELDLLDPDEVQVCRIWDTILAVRKGQTVGYGPDGTPVFAAANGKLTGTRLKDWHKVVGGWGATIVGPIGAYEEEQFAAAVGKIASAFSMKKSMITVLPDPDDENQSTILAQRSSPIKDTVRWSGPGSIDVVGGRAPIAMYADGEQAFYEIYRPGWGVPHVAVFGTTGSGKSEVLNQLFTIDRYAHYVDERGQAHGIVADFLIDPQQGQSFAPFLDDLAAPVATSLEEAMVLVEALTEEMLRRNRYLARIEYVDERGRKRKGRKWWNPLIDGPILSLTIDEAHDYLSDRAFATAVTKAGRMWRKCGGQVRIATHTPLLTDLGGSMALRDMLTGGFVWVGRTANGLSGPTAFNGRLPADPRKIPAIPGMAYILSGLQPKAMLARTEWEPDYYDWVRDENDQPIGCPAVLPQVTLDTFGPAYAQWVKAARSGDAWTPAVKALEPVAPQRSVDAVLLVMARAETEGRRSLSMDELDAALTEAGMAFSTATVRGALKQLRDRGLVTSADRRHSLTEAGVIAALDFAEQVNA